MHPHQKARIRWQCRRGMLELDLILQDYLTRSLDQMQENERIVFEKLLTYPDPQLYAWLMGEETPDSLEISHIVQLIRMRD